MDTPLAWLSDQLLIDLARKAGLCFPDCWHLDEDTDPEQQQANRQWVDASENEDIRERREQILEISSSQRHERLKQLNKFARLIGREYARKALATSDAHRALYELFEPL